MSQEAAAEAVGINRVVLNYYESDRRQVPLSTAAALARLYGTSLKSLLAGEDPTVLAQPSRVLRFVRFALERSIITAGDAAEVLGTSTEEIRQLLARPGAAEGERHARQDLEDAAFAQRES